jgi:hypothetical protein
MKPQNLFSCLNLLIFTFFTVAIPAYYFSENAVIGQFRNYFYLVSLIAGFILIIMFLAENKSPRSNFLLTLIAIFFGWTALILGIAATDYPIEWVNSDIVNLTYCLQALVLGINFVKIFNHRFFSILITIIWFASCCLILAKVDPSFMQAIYGKEDESFSGSYQYIGDTYTFLSVLLIAKVMSGSSMIHFQQLSLNTSIGSSKQKSIMPIILLIVSILILFLNGSRASLLSFLIFAIYILYYLFKRLNPGKLFFITLVSSLMLFIVFAYSHDFLIHNVSYDSLFSNRSLEIASEGRSTSGEGRAELYRLGIQDIFHNPITGNYIERNLYRGQGTYIHNFLSLIQDFGIFTFLSYLCLIIYGIKACLTASSRVQPCNSIAINGILIISIVQVLFFREAMGFYPLFINFGMALRTFSESPKETSLN